LPWRFYTAAGAEKQEATPGIADVSFGGYKATNLANPTANQDATTKAYVDTKLNDVMPFRASMAGQNAAYIGGGTWVTASGQSPGVGNPAGNWSGVTWTIPVDGYYRIDLWVRLDNASAGMQAGIRPNRNGTAQDAGGTARVYNGIAAMYAAASGIIGMSLLSGDTIRPEVMHTDTGARTVSWRMMIEQLLNVGT
jgi:hypothetical protein